jgi:hypothetical protein
MMLAIKRLDQDNQAGIRGVKCKHLAIEDFLGNQESLADLLTVSSGTLSIGRTNWTAAELDQLSKMPGLTVLYLPSAQFSQSEIDLMKQLRAKDISVNLTKNNP